MHVQSIPDETKIKMVIRMEIRIRWELPIRFLYGNIDFDLQTQKLLVTFQKRPRSVGSFKILICILIIFSGMGCTGSSETLRKKEMMQGVCNKTWWKVVIASSLCCNHLNHVPSSHAMSWFVNLMLIKHDPWHLGAPPELGVNIDSYRSYPPFSQINQIEAMESGTVGPN